MNEINYIRVTGAVFLVLSAAHLLRVFLLVPILIGSWTVPLGLSLVPVAVGAYLASCAFRLDKGN